MSSLSPLTNNNAHVNRWTIYEKNINRIEQYNNNKVQLPTRTESQHHQQRQQWRPYQTGGQMSAIVPADHGLVPHRLLYAIRNNPKLDDDNTTKNAKIQTTSVMVLSAAPSQRHLELHNASLLSAARSSSSVRRLNLALHLLQTHRHTGRRNR